MVRAIWLAWLPLVMTSCNVVLSHPEALTAVPSNRGLIYGRLLLQGRAPGRRNEMRFEALQGDQEAYFFDALDHDGVFSCLVPPGRYRVVELDQAESITGVIVLLTPGERGPVFEAAGGEARYVGTMAVDEDRLVEPSLWRHEALIHLELQDDFAGVTRTLREIHPALTTEPKRGLAVLR